ncbi:hypothetical protein B0H13DRAFT_1853688 [Mycena leptocephala]|nr:hypothetical protein B0H13DRAFT_1853688 [Mycena leptocephala]
MSFSMVILFTDQLNRAIGVEYFGKPNEGTSRVKTRATNLWETSAYEYLEDVAGLYRKFRTMLQTFPDSVPSHVPTSVGKNVGKVGTPVGDSNISEIPEDSG